MTEFVFLSYIFEFVPAEETGYATHDRCSLLLFDRQVLLCEDV